MLSCFWGFTFMLLYAPLQPQGPLGDDVTAGLDGSLSSVMVVCWWSDCAVDAALRAAGVGIVGLAQNHWTAEEHLGRKSEIKSWLSGILNSDWSIAALCFCTVCWLLNGFHHNPISIYLLMHSDELEGLQAEADHWLVACVELNRFIQDAPEEHYWCRH